MSHIAAPSKFKTSRLTPIEPQEDSGSGRFRARSLQSIDTLVHEAQSCSSSRSNRHFPTGDNVKHVIANLGPAARTVGAAQIKPHSLVEEDVVEGVRTFLSGIQNIIRREKARLKHSVEIIGVS